MHEAVFNFEELVRELFTRNLEGMEVLDIPKGIKDDDRGRSYGADLFIYHEGKLKSAVEIKYYRGVSSQLRMLRNASYNFGRTFQNIPSGSKVIVTFSQINDIERKSLTDEFNFAYIDRIDLIRIALPYPDLLERMVEMFSIDRESMEELNKIEDKRGSGSYSKLKDIITSESKKTSDTIKNKKTSKATEKQREQAEQAIQLRDSLINIKPGNGGWLKYEKKCTEILKFLFELELDGWFDQQTTDDKLNRYDTVCRIKSIESVWGFITSQLHSQYIVFEFKNYTKKITPMQILTTEKYLFENALRKVAIIISRKGPSSEALKMRDGAMRDSGKMILTLKDDDLVNMMEDMVSGTRSPSDYLYNLVDDMLLKLSR